MSNNYYDAMEHQQKMYNRDDMMYDEVSIFEFGAVYNKRPETNSKYRKRVIRALQYIIKYKICDRDNVNKIINIIRSTSAKYVANIFNEFFDTELQLLGDKKEGDLPTLEEDFLKYWSECDPESHKMYTRNEVFKQINI